MPISLGTHCTYTPNPYGPAARLDLLTGMPIALHAVADEEVRVVWPHENLDNSDIQGYKVISMSGLAFGAREDELAPLPESPKEHSWRQAEGENPDPLAPGSCETCGHGPQRHDLEGYCECMVGDCPCNHYAFDPLTTFDEVDPERRCPHCASFLLPEPEGSESSPKQFSCGSIERDGRVIATVACDQIGALYKLAYGCPDCGVRHKRENCRTLSVANKNAEIELMHQEIQALGPLLRVLGKWRGQYVGHGDVKEPTSDIRLNAALEEIYEAYDEWREKQEL